MLGDPGGWDRKDIQLVQAGLDTTRRTDAVVVDDAMSLVVWESGFDLAAKDLAGHGYVFFLSAPLFVSQTQVRGLGFTGRVEVAILLDESGYRILFVQVFLGGRLHDAGQTHQGTCVPGVGTAGNPREHFIESLLLPLLDQFGISLFLVKPCRLVDEPR